MRSSYASYATVLTRVSASLEPAKLVASEAVSFATAVITEVYAKFSRNANGDLNAGVTASAETTVSGDDVAALVKAQAMLSTATQHLTAVQSNGTFATCQTAAPTCATLREKRVTAWSAMIQQLATFCRDACLGSLDANNQATSRCRLAAPTSAPPSLHLNAR